MFVTREWLFAGICSGVWTEICLISRDCKDVSSSHLGKTAKKGYIIGDTERVK